MNLIVGGGKYGSEAVEYLLKHSKPFIVVDENEECFAVKNFELASINKVDEVDLSSSKNYFLKGGMKEALEIIEKLKPEYVFTTAPIHVAAALVKEKYSLKEWNEGINCILVGIPFKVVISVGKGSVVVSYNRDKACKPKCEAPDVCPITKIKKPCPMYELLRFASPTGIILQSHQLKPGLGALKGKEVLEMLEGCHGKDKIVIGTACRCHGVVTALKAKPRSGNESEHTKN
ncbi:hypothetical protein DRP05_13510 [Archaeoglobales archaeon]|nr:MAG: hypothetical protein DRP05_13510 [Archaeoglobales archaeon]